MQESLNARREFFRERGRSGRKRWLSVPESPFSRAYTYDLIKAGVIASVSVSLPGSRRNRRLIDGDSLDAFLERLMAEQTAEKVEHKD
jgi:hypothetical protein